MVARSPRRAVRIAAHGGPEVLETIELAAAEPGPGEVRVRVTHVALNHLDLWVRRGVPGHDFHLPRIPGSDVAGVLDDGRRVALHPSWGCGTCGACLAGRQNRCARFTIRGETADGGCVTELVVPEWQLLPVPTDLSSVEAAALPLTLLTAWHMLVERAKVQRGERVLVQAGGSGVGIVAIQIAKLLGAEVHTTASTAERRARLEALGAQAWPYEEVGKGLRNVEVVVDSVGGGEFTRAVKALAWGGRLVTCGATAGPEAALNLRMLFFKQLTLLGSTMGSSADMIRAWREVGTIRPVVDRVFPMSQIADAHRHLEGRQAFGKVVLAQDLG